MPDAPPPYIVMFAKALHARRLAKLLRAKNSDDPVIQRRAQIMESARKFRFKRAHEMVMAERRARGDTSTSMSPLERLLITAEYFRHVAELITPPRGPKEQAQIIALEAKALHWALEAEHLQAQLAMENQPSPSSAGPPTADTSAS